MRLICPNCNAQYEVDDAAIPEGGRDVQCSACGQLWFQPGVSASHEPEEIPAEQTLANIIAEDSPADGEKPLPEALSQTDDPPEKELMTELTRIVSARIAAGAVPSPAEESAVAEVPESEISESETSGFEVTGPDTTAPEPDIFETPLSEEIESSEVAEFAEEAPEPAPVASAPAPEELPVPETIVSETPSLETPAPEIMVPEITAPETIAKDENVIPRSAPALPPEPPVTSRPTMDENLLSILREEVERETEARRAEGTLPEPGEDGSEETPDTPLPAEGAATEAPLPVAAEDDTAPAEFRVPLTDTETEEEDPGARLLAEEEEEHRIETEEDIPSASAARELLPDVEEINSSLRAVAERRDIVATRPPMQEEDTSRTGFRTGFLSVILLAAVAAALYGFAPRIASQAPALSPALSAYVTRVDAGRIWLDGELRAAIGVLHPGQKG